MAGGVVWSVGGPGADSLTVRMFTTLTIVVALVAPHAPAAREVAPLLDQAKAIAEAREVTAEKYPNADIVLVAEHQRTSFEADGTYDAVDDEYVKALTEAGRKEARERSMG